MAPAPYLTGAPHRDVQIVEIAIPAVLNYDGQQFDVRASSDCFMNRLKAAVAIKDIEPKLAVNF